MSSETPAENGTPSGSVVGGRTSADASGGRAPSESAEAKRKRESRAAKKQGTSSTGGRGGGEPVKGNVGGFGGLAGHMGEALSPGEAKRQLYYGHVGLAKAIRSEIDLSELDEEFTVAGENYSYVANHMFPVLRVVIRFIAPVVLVAVLVVIWGHMIAATPWIHHVRDWWQARRNPDPRESPPPPAAGYQPQPPAEPQSAVDAGGTPREPVQQPPAIRRPLITRNHMGGHRL